MGDVQHHQPKVERDAPFDIVRECGSEIGERHGDEKSGNVGIVRTH